MNSYVKAIQVTNQKLKKYLLKNGVSKKKYFRYLLIDIENFLLQVLKKIQNKKINENYLTIASFQKDGEGWGDGMIPKKLKDQIYLLK